MKRRRKNPKDLNVTYLQNKIYFAIIEANPYQLANAFLLVTIGTDCKDCDSSYRLCKCEFCDDCKFNICLCKYYKNKLTIRKTAWTLAKKYLVRDDLEELKKDIFLGSRNLSIDNYEQIKEIIND